jgi:hypothetical protein
MTPDEIQKLSVKGSKGSTEKAETVQPLNQKVQKSTQKKPVETAIEQAPITAATFPFKQGDAVTYSRGFKAEGKILIETARGGTDYFIELVDGDLISLATIHDLSFITKKPTTAKQPQKKPDQPEKPATTQQPQPPKAPTAAKKENPLTLNAEGTQSSLFDQVVTRRKVHFPCPSFNCNSTDAAVKYPDGSIYCFECQKRYQRNGQPWKKPSNPLAVVEPNGTSRASGAAGDAPAPSSSPEKALATASASNASVAAQRPPRRRFPCPVFPEHTHDWHRFNLEAQLRFPDLINNPPQPVE